MKVYFEYVFIDNIIINYLILVCTYKCLHLKTAWYKLLCASLVGAIVAVILPLFNISSILILAPKISCAVIMLFIAFKFKKLKNFIICFISFLSFTFLMGGACIALLLIIDNQFTLSNFGSYNANIPLGLMLGIIAFYVWLVSILAKYIYKRRDALQFIGKIIIELNDKKVQVVGFLDSGNRLFDNVTGLPVIIVSSSAINSILTADLLKSVYLPNLNSKKLKNAHFIQYATLSGGAKPMLVFEPQSVVFDYHGQKTSSKVMIGVTTNKFCDAVNYQALLHPSMLV